MVKTGKTKLRKMSPWNWFVLVSALIIPATLTAVVWLKPDNRDLESICSLLGGLAWIFVLREFGVLKSIKDNLSHPNPDDSKTGK
jgi:hypothetical protein